MPTGKGPRQNYSCGAAQGGKMVSEENKGSSPEKRGSLHMGLLGAKGI